MWQELLATTKRLEALERLNEQNAAEIDSSRIASLEQLNAKDALEIDALMRRVVKLETLNEKNHAVLSIILWF